MLADRFNLHYYKIDDYEEKHIRNANPAIHPTMSSWAQMSWDEIWMRPPIIQVEEEITFYHERFEMVLNELLAIPREKPIVMEGAVLLPELILQLGVDGNRVIYMVPSKEFQLTHYSQRGFIQGILSECANPSQAFENWMERDHLFTKRVGEQAQKLGYKVIYVDGKQTVDQNFTTVTEHFGLT